MSALPDDKLSEIRSQRIGFIFQNFNLIQQLTVLENLEVPMFYLGIPPAERRRRATQLAEEIATLLRRNRKADGAISEQRRRARCNCQSDDQEPATRPASAVTDMASGLRRAVRPASENDMLPGLPLV